MSAATNLAAIGENMCCQMKLNVHVGVHRTGTTNLQTFLSRHRQVLAAKGVGYPGSEVNHQKLAWALMRGDAGAVDVLALVESTPDADLVILSGEDFSIHTDLSWLAKVAQRFEIRVVFYLRRQDHWLNSWYNQHVKWPFEPRKAVMSPDAFLETIEDFYWIDYASTLERWAKVLGRENIDVGVVERGQVEDVTRDFLGRLGIDERGFIFDNKRANDSLPVETLEIARCLGIQKLPPRERSRLIGALRAGLADKDSGIGTVYSPEQRNRVLDRFEISNQHVAQTFFRRDRLFYEPRPTEDAPFFCLPDMPRQTLLQEWIAPVIHELLKTRN